MLTYPNISPVLFSFGFLQIRWYGLMYIIGFSIAWILGSYRAKNSIYWDKEKVTDLIFYSAWGILIGGRLGYFLIYGFNNIMIDPLVVFKVWEGGMSFHGGLIGVLSSLFLFHKKTKIPVTEILDFVVPLAPLGIGFGRIGNFINGELPGRITDGYFGMIFPMVDNMPRHPSQLYESFFEGFLLFIVLWVFSVKKRAPLLISGLFLFYYGVIRFMLEFFRDPDAHIGFIFNWMTMGQILSMPMIIIGIILMVYAKINYTKT